jgi:hypothetical protein
VQPGVAAAKGTPSGKLFNGLATVQDASFRYPKHGVVAAAGKMPSALAAEGLPYVPDVRVLARRDAVILYFSNVADAADYRAYAVVNGVTFTSTANGAQPRGAVIGCAGYRQHGFESAVSGGNHQRELMQVVELPGLVKAGNYTIVLEAIASPCPFTGLQAHTDATITGTNFNALDSTTYTYKGTHYAKFASFNTVRATYGNEIINGQGAANSWESRMTAPMGLPVPPNDSAIPSDPAVVARSAIAVQLPFFDETANAPVFDVGSNAIEDNFSEDLVVDPATYTANPDYSSGNVPGAPKFEIPGQWQFWGRYLQRADGQSGIIDGKYTPKGLLGFQVFQRHGRLYTTFGDAGQDIGGSIGFASSRVVPQQLDSTKYVHSMFRINSEATERRYWTWTLCGGQTREELQDPTTREYKIRPVFYESSFATAASGLYGDNPSIGGPPLGAVSEASAKNANAKECLSIAQEGEPEYPVNGRVRTSGLILAQIHPAGYAKGIIPLGNNNSDPKGARGFRYKLDAAGKNVGPMIEPFDQVSPLTHYDVFVRPDRLVMFINGRQGFCVDLSSRPLTMKYGMLTYGDLLYHSSLEWQNIAAPMKDGLPFRNSQLYHTTLNSPIATSRAWDVVAESQQIDIPSQFVFDPATCFKPASTAVR